MIFFILSGFLLCLVPQLFAQQCGRVFDVQTKEPLIGVHVYLGNHELVAVSNNEGEFCIPSSYYIHPDTTTLSFSHISYNNRQIPWQDFQSYQSIVYLRAAPHALGEVTVSARELYFTLPYSTLSPMQAAVSSFGAVQAGNYIYVGGGDESYREELTEEIMLAMEEGRMASPRSKYEGYSGRMYRYDIMQDQWEKVSPGFRKRAYHAMFHYRNKLYVIGGKGFSTNKKKEYLDHTVEIYDIRKDTVVVDPVNPHQAIHFASCLFGDHIFLLGGSVKESQSGKRIHTNQVHTLDLKEGLWYEMPSLPAGMEAGGVGVGGKIYMIGGMQDDMVFNRIQSYNISEGSMMQEGYLQHVVSYPALAAHREIIYVFEQGLMQTYHVGTGETLAYKVGLDLQECRMFCTDDRLYILGGYTIDEEGTRQPSRGLYSIDLSEFEQTRLYTEK